MNDEWSIINAFKGYLSINELQINITIITYLFYHAKFVLKKELADKKDRKNIIKYLKSSTNRDKEFITKLFEIVSEYIKMHSISGFLDYLNKLSEDEIIEVICNNYEIYARSKHATSDDISKLIYLILEKVKGKRVIDLCSYNGNFLSYYAKQQKDYTYTGIEINEINNLIAKVRMEALKVKYNLITQDIFQYNFEKKHDKVFCEYPFQIKLNDIFKKESTLLGKYNSRISPVWFFAEKVIEAMKENGKGVILVNSYILDKDQDIEYRKELIKRGLIEAIISLPGNLLANTAIQTSLIIFSYGNKNIKIIDATQMYTKNILKNSLKSDEIYQNYVAEEENAYTKMITKSDLEKKNYSFLVERYMSENFDEEEIYSKRAKLCEVSDIMRSRYFSSIELNQKLEEDKVNAKIVNMNNIVDGEINGEMNTINIESDEYKKYELKEKDALISSKGNINRIAIVENIENEHLIPGGNIITLRVKQDIINPYYLKMFLESKKGVKELNSIRRGGILPSISAMQLKEINIPMISIDKQNELVEKYIEKQKRIKKMEDKIEKLKKDLQETTDSIF